MLGTTRATVEGVTYDNGPEIGGQQDDSEVYTLLRSHGEERALIVAFNRVVRLSGDDEII